MVVDSAPGLWVDSPPEVGSDSLSETSMFSSERTARTLSYNMVKNYEKVLLRFTKNCFELKLLVTKTKLIDI